MSPHLLQQYADGVGHAESAREVARLLKTCVDQPFRPWGLGVDPDDLGDALWDVRETLKAARSLLHVGTGHGFAYFAIREFARSRNPDIACHTVDAHNCVIGDVLPLIRPDRAAAPLEAYDVVVLSGRQTLVEFLAEYNAVGALARACLVLDVRGAWWWESFKRRCDTREHGGSALMYARR